MEFANPASSDEEDFDLHGQFEEESDQDEEYEEMGQLENDPGRDEENVHSSNEESDSDDTSDSESDREEVNDNLILQNTKTQRSENQSMEELLKLRDKIGTKSFNKKFVPMLTKNNAEETDNKNNKSFKKKPQKRKNKNHPQEISSKKPWKLNQQRANIDKKTRDPRFDDTCGSKYDRKAFDQRYSFVYDIQEKEISSLKQKLKKDKNVKSKHMLRDVISRMEHRQKARVRREEDDAVLKEWRKTEKDKIVKGKKPFFLKKSEARKLVNEHRNTQLKNDGLLDKVSRRQEKKMASKQKKKLPDRRY